MKQEQSEPIEGGCLCRAVRYTIGSPIVAARQCWCRDCQYLSCGSASISIIVKTEHLRTEGALSEFRSLADSGSHMVRSFCPTCGTQVLSAAMENPDFVAVRVGTLDDPVRGAPEGVIWTASAPAWASLPRLPHAERQPLMSPWPLR